MIALPGDISKLVQTTYDDEWVPDFPPARLEIYETARKEKEKMIKDQEGRAADFQLRGPREGLGTLLNLMSMKISDSSEKRGEAAVRDGTSSIEVLVMCKRGERAYLLPWVQGGQEIPKDRVPDEAIAKALANCTVRLPALFGKEWMIDKTIKELETVSQEAMLERWQQSHWLKGELFLILDESMATTLCGYTLRYDRELGLLLEKGGE
jgi:CRISPR-associated endonuclease/helicase Cas3